MEEEEWLVKPMNCPLHVNIYKSTQHSYKTLPLRYAELGTVYRYERSGTLHGLFRVRGFTQVSLCCSCMDGASAPAFHCLQADSSCHRSMWKSLEAKRNSYQS